MKTLLVEKDSTSMEKKPTQQLSNNLSSVEVVETEIKSLVADPDGR